MSGKLSPKILIAITLLIAGFAVLFGVGLRGSLVYYLTVSEFLEQGNRDLGENFRINGKVVEGSIERPPSGLGATFLMSDGARELQVSYGKETPDTFVDGSEVVVEGVLGPDGVFVAHTLLAKCPSKYEAANSAEDYKTAGSSSSDDDPPLPANAPR
ncbi:MAG TPA: cytochrome c maturation protein CcmE [Candidatus Polarisedimenticolia bacterium]|nr:cytochrome c maturation protein CcmE [Candidatus Polarisedimenticolia bacterium]